MSAEEGARLGFFGKLPAHGDFVRWGLSRAFVSAWDAWLQAVWCAGGERAPMSAQARHCWRFALAGGVCGPAAASGLLLASTDRVGRRFPLLVAVEGGIAGDVLLDELQRVAQEAIDAGGGADELADRLRGLQPGTAPAAADGRTGSRWWHLGETVEEFRSPVMPDASAFATLRVAQSTL